MAIQHFSQARMVLWLRGVTAFYPVGLFTLLPPSAFYAGDQGKPRQAHGPSDSSVRTSPLPHTSRGLGTGGCETCGPEAEVHEQSHRVLQGVVGQAVGLLQRVDQPEDEAVLNHGRLQRAPARTSLQSVRAGGTLQTRAQGTGEHVRGDHALGTPTLRDSSLRPVRLKQR